MTATRDRLVDVTIDVIHERGGAVGVSLREVARRAGCAATNVYNYFPDLAALLNAANLQIIADFNERVPAQAMRAGAPEAVLELGVRAFVRYAVEHKGWFNSFHYERHGLPLTTAAIDAAEHAGNQMGELVRLATAGRLDDEEVRYVTRVVYAYLVGELCAVVTGRERPADEADYVETLTNTCISVFRALVSALPDTGEVLT
jgi:AcrR family transcriptional regulator